MKVLYIQLEIVIKFKIGNDIIKNKQAIYDLTLDQKINKIGGGNKLVNYDFDKLPTYLKQNKKNYAEWLDQVKNI